MTRPTDVGRRTYIKGVTTAVLAGSVPLAATAARGQGGGQGDDRTTTIPPAQPFIGDLDEMLTGDGEFQVQNRYDGDPAEQAGGDREWVLHYTTTGEETQDYPAALINLTQQLDDHVTLADIRGDDGGLAFDFYVGPDHDQYIPGQVYLVVQTPDQKDHQEAWGLYRNVRKDGPVREWRTLDVVAEMTAEEPDAEGGDPVWNALQIDVDPEGFRADFETFTDAILEQAVQTRDQTGDGEVDDFGNVFDRFGGDAKLLAVGLGSGSSRTPTRRDIYFDDYRLTAGGDEHTFELPAVLETNADVQRDGQITATLAFDDEEPEGLSLDDVDVDSVRLYPYSQIVPPTEEGAEANQVDVADGELQARFPPGRVRNLEGIDSGTQPVVVAGQFDVDHVAWFFGLGQTSI